MGYFKDEQEIVHDFISGRILKLREKHKNAPNKYLKRIYETKIEELSQIDNIVLGWRSNE